jgi:hypothetical protein
MFAFSPFKHFFLGFYLCLSTYTRKKVQNVNIFLKLFFNKNYKSLIYNPIIFSVKNEFLSVSRIKNKNLIIF